MSARQKSNAVILNGVSPRAQAGAKRSEGSLTVLGGGGGDGRARIPARRLRPFRVSDSSLRHCRKASKGSVQNDGCFFSSAAAFTFVEVLAAMAFIAILFPVLASALHVSSGVGSAAERSTMAVQLGENRLNELTLGDAWSSAESRGDFGTDWPGFRWELKKTDWQTGAMTELVMDVFFKVQGREQDVRLSTLVNESLSTAATTTTP